MKGPDKTTGAGVVATEEKDFDKEKRSRASESMTQQQAGQASGTDDRPMKTRKVVLSDVDGDKDDPVALARRALEMFRQEVEEDGDYVEPDTTPGGIEPRTVGCEKVLPAISRTKPSTPSDATKALRQPIIISHEDDPSIL